MVTSALVALIQEVHASAGENFSGIGVIVADVATKLPILPLRPAAVSFIDKDTRSTLITISVDHHDLHDGFHVLSPELDILALSQYFSPPIIAGLGTDPLRRLGGRYMAALFGSTLPGVLATGIASNNYGVAVFVNGREVSVS